MRLPLLRGLVGVLLAGSLSRAAPADPPPTPGKAEKTAAFVPGPFQCWMVTGEHAGRYHAPVTANGLNPTVLIFTREIDEPDKPLSKLIKKLDEFIGKHPDARLACTVVLLNDGGYKEALEKGGEEFSNKLADISKFRAELDGKMKEYLKTTELKHIPFGVDHPAGPESYNLADTAQVTVLFYSKQIVLDRFEFTKDQLTDAEAEKVSQRIEKEALHVEELSRPKKPKR